MTKEKEMTYFLNDKPIEYEDLMKQMEEHKTWLAEEDKRRDDSNKPEKRSKKKFTG